MKYLEISSDLFLVEQPIAKPKNHKSEKESLSHIWIYDRSGSMGYVLPQLAKDLIEKAKTIPVGDTITLGWFSGQGEFNFVLKGFKVTEARDYKILETTINQNKNTVGMTCFSEILADTETVIKDLAVLGNKFSLCFFTDGYPTVSNHAREVESIYTAIKAIQGKVTSSMLVGYGNYYNKQLMSDMAERLGGALVHSSDLATFSTSMDSFLGDARENDSKLKVELKAAGDVVFGINGKQISLYQSEGGTISFIPTKAEVDRVYVLSKRIPSGASPVELNDSNVHGKSKDESMVKAAYAVAYILTQRTKTDLALEVLAKLGDKAMIDQVSNAFTNAEYGAVEAKIQNAMLHSNARFLKGRDVKYLPAQDAFCLLDVVELLMKDPEANFYPNHPAFEYSRIGAGSKTVDGYPKFKSAPDAKSPLNALTWNDTKLNLSIRALINGTVTLNGDAASVGLSQEYPTFVFRNYALVKDGFLNVSKLPVSLSLGTFAKLVDHGVIDSPKTWSAGPLYFEGQVYVLNLDAVPVINRKIAEGRTSATDLAKKVIEETKIEAQLKALKFFREELMPVEQRKMAAAATPEQAEFLLKNGIGRSGFAPPTEKIECTDFYMAKDFEIKLKGLSSLPKVDEVIEKSEKGAKLTPSALLVKSGIDLYQTSLAKSASEKVKLAWLEEKIADLSSGLIRVRSDVQKTKFAVILGKKWFDEFSSRENNKLKVGDQEVTISLTESRVEL